VKPLIQVAKTVQVGCLGALIGQIFQHNWMAASVLSIIVSALTIGVHLWEIFFGQDAPAGHHRQSGRTAWPDRHIVPGRYPRPPMH
jgi:hypothetical protein